MSLQLPQSEPTDTQMVSVDAVHLNPTESETTVPVVGILATPENRGSNRMMDFREESHEISRQASIPPPFRAALDDEDGEGPRNARLPQTVPRRRSSVGAIQAATSRVSAASLQASTEFHATFGFLGVPMVVAFAFSALTLFSMAFVQVFPTQIANHLMRTHNLDHGDFWLLTEPSPALVVLSTLMLAFFGCCYVALAYVMVFARMRLLHHAPTKPNSSPDSTRTNREPVLIRSESLIHQLPRMILYCRTKPPTHVSRRVRSRSQRQSPHENSFMLEFTRFDGIYHAYYNALFDLPKLIFQTAALGTYLTEGFPLPLVYFYVAMVMANWLVSLYRFQHGKPDSELTITRLFYLFDLFFAVFAPIVVITYAYSHFVLDRGVFSARDRTLSPGSFDRIARLFADPVEVDVFRYAFHHLQLTKAWYVAGKCCLNTLVVYKWKKIILFLVFRRQAVLRSDQTGQTTTMSRSPSRPIKEFTSKATWRMVVKRVVRVHGKRRHLLFGITVFLTSMAAIPTYVSVAISSSLQSCSLIPQCRVVSYRWLASHESDHCPCIVFIDRDQIPRTFDAWINAPNASAPLALAARSGHLKTVQIINRAVLELPIELRNCTELEQIILLYTKTQSLPDWVGAFHNLHYLHVESDFLNFPLRSLPLDMFEQTPKVRFIRFGGAARLRVFPSLQGLGDLSTLVLSIPRELEEIPDFSDLHKLKTLIIADATHARGLPSLQPLKSLTTFSLFRRNAMCCNGFITGTCDLTSYQCMPRPNEDPVTCTDSRLPEEDRALLEHINGFVCSSNLTSDVADSEPTVYSTDTLCEGVRFKQCEMGGRSGMCYNGRMQVIHCDVFGEYEAMRRLEIAEGVGPACDPEVEAWMGCR